MGGGGEGSMTAGSVGGGEGTGGFDISRIFSPEFVAKAANMLDPTALMKMLAATSGDPSGGGQGLKPPMNMDEAAGPYSSMLAPTEGGGSGQGLRPPTREAATLVAPTTGGLASYAPQPTASPLLQGLSAEQLRLLAAAQAAGQQPQPQTPMPRAVAPPRGAPLPQPMQMGMPGGQPATRQTMSQLLYGR